MFKIPLIVISMCKIPLIVISMFKIPLIVISMFKIPLIVISMFKDLTTIASVNVSSRKYRIMRPWSCELLTSPLGGAVCRAVIVFFFFSLKIAVNYSVKYP